MSKVIAVLASGLLIGAFPAYGKLPAAPQKTEAEKKAEGDKAATAKAKAAADLGKAQDRVVTNYKKNRARK